MLALRDPAAVAGLSDDSIRAYLEERFEGLTEPGETYAPETHGWFLLLGPGDDPDEAGQVFDCFPLLTSPTGGARYGDPDFRSPFEWITDLGSFYEGVILMSDGGDFVGVIIPKLSGMDARLLEYCETHASDEPMEL